MKFNKERLVSIAESIDDSVFRAFLLDRGWTQGNNVQEGLDLFVYGDVDDENYDEIVVPRRDNERYSGYILSACRELARGSGVSLLDVLNEVSTSTTDRVKFRLDSPLIESGAVSLLTFQRFFTGVIAFLQTSVKDVSKLESRRAKEITEMMNSASFGQTERGSYVVNVFMPLKPEGVEETLYRNGLIYLLDTVGRVSERAERDESFDFLDGDSTSLGMLEAVKKVCFGQDSTFEITVDWSVVADKPDVPQSRVSFKGRHSAYVSRWIERLEAKSVSTEPVDFFGIVKEMKGDSSDEKGNTYGAVDVLIFERTENSKNYVARVELNADDYAIAWESHREKKLVGFSGIYSKKGGIATIKNVSVFRLMESGNRPNE